MESAGLAKSPYTAGALGAGGFGLPMLIWALEKMGVSLPPAVVVPVAIFSVVLVLGAIVFAWKAVAEARGRSLSVSEWLPWILIFGGPFIGGMWLLLAALNPTAVGETKPASKANPSSVPALPSGGTAVLLQGVEGAHFHKSIMTGSNAGMIALDSKDIRVTNSIVQGGAGSGRHVKFSRSGEYQKLSNKQLLEKTIEFSKSLVAYQTIANELSRRLSDEQQEKMPRHRPTPAEAREISERNRAESLKLDQEIDDRFTNGYFPTANALASEIVHRLDGNLAVPNNDSQAIKAATVVFEGQLTGINPMHTAAIFLETLAKRLPPE
jgi:hypothetical protein